MTKSFDADITGGILVSDLEFRLNEDANEVYIYIKGEPLGVFTYLYENSEPPETVAGFGIMLYQSMALYNGLEYAGPDSLIDTHDVELLFKFPKKDCNTCHGSGYERTNFLQSRACRCRRLNRYEDV